MSADEGQARFVVVGAGSAGCVVAGRLAEAGATTVLIEAGPSSGGRDGVGRAGLVDPQRNQHRFWPSIGEVRTPAGSALVIEHPYWMGRGLGGGSAVNAMLITPGDRTDYDRWARLPGCAEWNSEAMAPWLAKATATLNPEKRNPDADTADLVEEFDDAFTDVGLGPAGTTLDGDRCGLFTPMLATESGRRRSVVDAYLDLDNPNLSVAAGRTVATLLVESGSVRGVTLADGSVIRAETVVLAAGTVETARLLHNTGAVEHAGDWIRNHAAASVPVGWPAAADPDQPPQVHRVARWSAETSEVGGRSFDDGTTVTTAQPDLTALLMGPFRESAGTTGTVVVMASSVRSAGRLNLADHSPRLVSNRLTDPHDLARLRQGTRQVLAVCRRLSRLAGDDDRSNAVRNEIDDLRGLADNRLDDWLIEHPGPVYHAVGSCRMGRHDAGAVTEADPGRAGSVHGLDGVVVADASLFPDLVAGGLQLPVMAVAERVTAETLLGPRLRL